MSQVPETASIVLPLTKSMVSTSVIVPREKLFAGIRELGCIAGGAPLIASPMLPERPIVRPLLLVC